MTLLQAPPTRTIQVGMGEIHAVEPPTLLTAILGSCIGLCLYDEKLRIGGLAHVVLPVSNGVPSDPGKFADTAIPALIGEVRGLGAVPARLVAKLAGGAAMFGGRDSMKIGDANAESVLRLLRHHGIAVRGHDLGGNKGRRVTLDPETGRLRVDMVGRDPIVL